MNCGNFFAVQYLTEGAKVSQALKSIKTQFKPEVSPNKIVAAQGHLETLLSSDQNSNESVIFPHFKNGENLRYLEHREFNIK